MYRPGKVDLEDLRLWGALAGDPDLAWSNPPVEPDRALASLVTWELHGEDASTWNEHDELHRSHDRVIPGIEVRFEETPSDENLETLARLLVERDLLPRSVWQRVLVSGPFVRLLLPSASNRPPFGEAKALLEELNETVPVAEALFLGATKLRPQLDPGPNWPGWTVRVVDADLPPPAPHPAIERIVELEHRRDADERMRIVEVLGDPTEEGIADAVERFGRTFRDRAGVSHALLELLRWEHPAAAVPAHAHALGLLADGRWALVCGFTTMEKAEDPDSPIWPRNAVLFANKRGEFRRRLSRALAAYGLERSFPVAKLLREELHKFGRGEAVHLGAFKWLAGESTVAAEPEIQAALQARRAEPRYKAVIEELLAAGASSKKRKRDRKRKKRR